MYSRCTSCFNTYTHTHPYSVGKEAYSVSLQASLNLVEINCGGGGGGAAVVFNPAAAVDSSQVYARVNPFHPDYKTHFLHFL